MDGQGSLNVLRQILHLATQWLRRTNLVLPTLVGITLQFRGIMFLLGPLGPKPANYAFLEAIWFGPLLAAAGSLLLVCVCRAYLSRGGVNPRWAWLGLFNAPGVLAMAILFSDRPTKAIMTITVKLFAVLRERAGTGELKLELPAGSTVAAAIESLTQNLPALPSLARIANAVNQSYVPATTVLSDGDELALIPPVSGG